MKFPIGISFILFVFSSLVAAQDGPVYSPPIEFENEPTPERFMELEHPTADQLYLLPNPGPAEFNQLSPEQRGIYIDRLLQPGDYGPDKTGNRVIAVRFFSGSPDNIANHNEAFKVYLENVKNIDIVDVRGGGISLSSDGRTLSSSDASINLNDFDVKKNPLLGKQYKLSILDGKIYLSALLIPFTGHLHKSSDGELALKEGSIDGKAIKFGTELSIDKNRILKGKAKEFNGVSFLFGETPFQYDKNKNKLTLSNAHIDKTTKDVEMNVKGSIKIDPKTYQDIKGKLKVESGDKAKVNRVDIDNSPKEGKDIELRFGKKSFFSEEEGNYVRFSDGVQAGGEKFSLSFSPASLSGENLPAQGLYLNLPAKGYYTKGDYPAKGSDEELDIKKIQSIVGTTVDGKYGPATKAKVKDWQENIFKNTNVCLGRQTSSGCVGDGIFGKKSTEFVIGQSSPRIITVSPNKGKAEFSVGERGLAANFQGDVDLRIGNKKMHFDGQQLNKEIVRSVFSNELDIPAELQFFDSDGKKVSGTIKISGTETEFSKMTEAEILKRLATKAGIKPTEARCSKAVSALFNEQAPEGERFDYLSLTGSPASKAGVEGDAWEMSSNIQRKGGQLKFYSETELSEEQKQILRGLVQKTKNEYENRLGEIAALKLTNPQKYEKQKTGIIHELSDRMREQEARILNRELTSSIEPLEEGDVLSLYYAESPNLALAAAKGKEGHKNTHVGIVKSFKEETYDISRVSDVPSFLRKKLAVGSDASLYINQYIVRRSGSDTFEAARLENGVFLDQEGNEIISINSLKVRRPQVAHMIHYGGEKNPYHIENLDQTLDRKDMSLYAVTSPAEKVKQQIADLRPSGDSIRIGTPTKVCESESCQVLTTLERAEYRGMDKQVINSFNDQKIYGRIPEGQKNSFQAATLAVIERESGGEKGVQYIQNKLESLFYPAEDRSKGTFSSVKESTLQEAAKITGRDISRIDIDTDQGSIEATAVVMEAIFKTYIPRDRKTLTDQDKEVIASAWNVGIKAEYTRKIARGDYTNLPEVQATSIKGQVSGLLTTLRGYRTGNYFNAYPQIFKETYDAIYCC